METLKISVGLSGWDKKWFLNSHQEISKVVQGIAD